MQNQLFDLEFWLLDKKNYSQCSEQWTFANMQSFGIVHNNNDVSLKSTEHNNRANKQIYKQTNGVNSIWIIGFLIRGHYWEFDCPFYEITYQRLDIDQIDATFR